MTTPFKKNIYFFLTLILLVCFCICHFVFSFYSNLESDDYNLIAYLRDKGFFGTIKFIYFTWEGAFGVLLISLLKIKFTLFSNSLFLHNVASTLITFYCLFYFIEVILAKYLSIVEKYYALILTILIYTDLYYNDMAINDTWYWLCGSVYFFMPVLLLFFSAILLKSKNRIQIGFAFLYFFIFGASRFNYAVILLSILGTLLAYFWLRKKTVNKMILTLFGIVLLALIIYVIAPGNYVRRSEELKRVLTLSDYVTGPIKMYFSFFYKYIVIKFPSHLIFSLPALFIGFLLRERINTFVLSKITLFKFIVTAMLFCAFCIYIQSLSMFIAKGSQTTRTLEMLSIIITLNIFAVYVLLGSRIKVQNLSFGLGVVSLLIAASFLLRRINLCYPIIKKYSAAVEERHRTIENALKNFSGDTLVLKKLPPASWLHSGELTKRAGLNPMNNVFLEEYYKPKFVLDIEN